MPGASETETGQNGNGEGQGGNGQTGAGTDNGQGAQSGTDATTPATLEEALAVITRLRRENAGARTKNNSLQAEHDTLAEKLKNLEAQHLAGTTNAQGLVDARDAEIAALKTKLTEAEAKLGGYAEVEETERTALLAKIPETKRGTFEKLSLDALRAVVPEIEAAKKESPGTGSSNGRAAAGLTLADAAATKDPALINAAFDAELAKIDPNFRPTAAPATAEK